MTDQHYFRGDHPVDICKDCGKGQYSALHYDMLPKVINPFESAIDMFCLKLKDKLLQSARAKGYHGDEDDGRKMYDSIIALAGEGHAMGEIIYKLTRYRRLKDPVDIEKAAAWCFLIWDADKRKCLSK